MTAMLAPPPYTLIAELTDRRVEDMLEPAIWEVVIDDAAALGIVQLHLAGDPLRYPELDRLVARARACEMYTNLIVSGAQLTRDRLAALRDAGLDQVDHAVSDYLGCIHITPSGRVRPCQVDDVRELSLAEIWEHLTL